MAVHQHDPDATELWNYFQSVDRLGEEHFHRPTRRPMNGACAWRRGSYDNYQDCDARPQRCWISASRASSPMTTSLSNEGDLRSMFLRADEQCAESTHLQCRRQTAGCVRATAAASAALMPSTATSNWQKWMQTTSPTWSKARKTDPDRLPDAVQARQRREEQPLIRPEAPVRRDGRSFVCETLRARAWTTTRPATASPKLKLARRRARISSKSGQLATLVAPRAADDSVAVDQERRSLRDVAQPAVARTRRRSRASRRRSSRRAAGSRGRAPASTRRASTGESREIAIRLDAGRAELLAPVTQELELVRSGRRPVEEIEEEKDRPVVRRALPMLALSRGVVQTRASGMRSPTASIAASLRDRRRPRAPSGRRSRARPRRCRGSR